MSFDSAPLYTFQATDLIIEVGDEGDRFDAHKHILAAQSEYFRKACRPNTFKESFKDLVKLPGVKPGTMIKILEWIYRSDVSISFPTSADEAGAVLDILAAADYLQIDGLGRDYGFKFERALGNMLVGSQPIDYALQIMNEIYRGGGTINQDELRALVIRVKEVDSAFGGYYSGRLRMLPEACEKIKEPNGEFFRELAIAVGTVLSQSRGK
ncbi:hypothetical protein Dda_6978 [Drechslerella dactyloides]|uniref:BTB domain-containing protein n=1 Tax=Drechslerella dactyloides TaxID=74499 RepID=A0AAD6ISX7_DREDA|nr:hypothetical protein Dda_6978 [Drechslerella dactyloides]